MRLAAAAALAALALLPARADDAKPLTVEQCISILNGLGSLNWQGQQLGDGPDKRPADAKPYRLGEARMTIALDIAALEPIRNSYVRAQQQFMAELPPIPGPKQGDASEANQAQAEQNRKALANQIAMLEKPCGVTPGRLKRSELRLGDDAEHNAIPPLVLAAFSAIVDMDK